MTENEIATGIAGRRRGGIAPDPGAGLLESVDEIVLAHELRARGLRGARQVPIDRVYEDVRIDGGFRADMWVEERVLLELGSLAWSTASTNPPDRLCVFAPLRD